MLYLIRQRSFNTYILFTIFAICIQTHLNYDSNMVKLDDKGGQSIVHIRIYVVRSVRLREEISHFNPAYEV